MNGQVSAHRALIQVPLLLPNQPDLEIAFVIDTGFVGFLTLPLAVVPVLNLLFLRRMPANLADDSTINVGVHAAVIIWNGEEREVEVLATGRRPLLGTLLLDGQELNVQFTEGGLVTIGDL